MTHVTLRASDGTAITFDDAMIAQGGQKDVFMATDRRQVAAFFRKPPDAAVRERLQDIVGRYRTRIFEQEGGDYWRDLFCWPSALIEWNGRTGLVVPAYRAPFFFEHGSTRDDMLGIRGKEKEGKWFASASNRNKFLDTREKGNLLTHLSICIKIARAVRRLHAAGLAHSDLSYKNVLVDPVGGNAAIIDIDGLVVPGKYPPDVVGTPDFIAPEVVATQALDRTDPLRALPSIATDRHALAVLIYMYLFFRHPLRGGKVHDADPLRDEAMSMVASLTPIHFSRSPRARCGAAGSSCQARPREPWGRFGAPYRWRLIRSRR
jgi:DNA-binding helix-hairpin-helix protein with protein kinase domain